MPVRVEASRTLARASSHVDRQFRRLPSRRGSRDRRAGRRRGRASLIVRGSPLPEEGPRPGPRPLTSRRRNEFPTGGRGMRFIVRALAVSAVALPLVAGAQGAPKAPQGGGG